MEEEREGRREHVREPNLTVRSGFVLYRISYGGGNEGGGGGGDNEQVKRKHR